MSQLHGGLLKHRDRASQHCDTALEHRNGVPRHWNPSSQCHSGLLKHGDNDFQYRDAAPAYCDGALQPCDVPSRYQDIALKHADEALENHDERTSSRIAASQRRKGLPPTSSNPMQLEPEPLRHKDVLVRSHEATAWRSAAIPRRNRTVLIWSARQSVRSNSNEGFFGAQLSASGEKRESTGRPSRCRRT